MRVHTILYGVLVSMATSSLSYFTLLGPRFVDLITLLPQRLSLGNGKLKRKELRASLVKGQCKNICLFLVVVTQNEKINSRGLERWLSG